MHQDPIHTARLSQARDSLAAVLDNNGRAARNCTRGVLARAINFSGIDKRNVEALAKSIWPAEGEAVARAAVGALTGAQTAEYAAFFGAMADLSLLGRLPLRRWPFRVRTLESGGIVGGEVPEGAATPIRVPRLNAFRLDARKFQAATVVTREALERGGAAVEHGLQDDLLRAGAVAVDMGLVADLIAAEDSSGFAGDHRFAVMLLNPVDAAELSNDVLNVTGGWFHGYPAITSNAVPAGDAILVDASRIAADWDAGEIDFADQAMLQADDTPTQSSSTPTVTTAVSLFQTNTIAIRATISAGWHIGTGAVEVIPLGS